MAEGLLGETITGGVRNDDDEVHMNLGEPEKIVMDNGQVIRGPLPGWYMGRVETGSKVKIQCVEGGFLLERHVVFPWTSVMAYRRSGPDVGGLGLSDSRRLWLFGRN